MALPLPPLSTKSELAAALSQCRTGLVGLAVASAIINVLYLTGSFYMLEIYDRVLASRSVPTLVGLSILAFALYAFQGILDLLRGRILIRVGRSIGQSLSVRVYHTTIRRALATASRGDDLYPIRDLDQVRSFLSTSGPLALCDLPWMPFYIAICFLFHFWIGIAALVGAIILVTLTILTEIYSREPTRTAGIYAVKRNAIAEASRRNAEALQALGMAPRVAAMWADVNIKFLDSHQRASDVSSGLGAASKVLRMVLQSAMLGVGALLVIENEATGGVIIAGSIIAARALAPVDLAIANWRNFMSFRQSWRRLKDLLNRVPAEKVQMPLPPPASQVTVESVSIVPPGETRIVVQDVSFKLEKGSGLGIIGPSAGGKSCLARTLVGVWRPVRGTIRLDGAALEQWSSATLGQHIGYLPQDVELLAGTVAQNIARFEPAPSSEKVIKAAQIAGVHEMVLRLAEGYETEVGENGAALSAGQRQRVALARAVYGDPFLVVLDEPNSNLDTEGEEALARAILAVRGRGGIVIVIAHRPSVIRSVDQVMLMVQGRVQIVGPRDEVLSKIVSKQQITAPPGLRVVPEPGGVAS